MLVTNKPAFASFNTTSEISNNLSGRGIFLLDAKVFNKPGNRSVRHT